MALPTTQDAWNRAYKHHRHRQGIDLLGQWVSGLEPEFVTDSSGFQLVGLTMAGLPNMVSLFRTPPEVFVKAPGADAVLMLARLANTMFVGLDAAEGGSETVYFRSHLEAGPDGEKKLVYERLKPTDFLISQEGQS